MKIKRLFSTQQSVILVFVFSLALSNTLNHVQKTRNISQEGAGGGGGGRLLDLVVMGEGGCVEEDCHSVGGQRLPTNHP